MRNVLPPKTRPTRILTISDEWKAHPDGVVGLVRDAGFRMEGDSVAQPCIMRVHHGVCIEISQWDL